MFGCNTECFTFTVLYCVRKTTKIWHNKYLCSNHFFESSFTTAERIDLMKGNEPYTLLQQASALSCMQVWNTAAFSQLQYFVIKTVLNGKKAGKFSQVTAHRIKLQSAKLNCRYYLLILRGNEHVM
jgi:hypothetical protein